MHITHKSAVFFALSNKISAEKEVSEEQLSWSFKLPTNRQEEIPDPVSCCVCVEECEVTSDHDTAECAEDDSDMAIRH